MAWLLPHGTEVVDRPDDSLAEVMLPETVDEHARHQRIDRRVDDPACQLVATASAF